MGFSVRTIASKSASRCSRRAVRGASAAAGRGPGCAAGFTLIEVMSAVVILLIIMAFLGRIYASATKAYQDNIKQAERDVAARAALDYIAREISGAMFENPSVDTNALLSMRYKANTGPGNFGLEGSDELWLVTGQNTPSGSGRAALQVVYFVENYAGQVTNPPPNAEYRFSLFRYDEHPKAGGSYNTYYGGSDGRRWSWNGAQPALRTRRAPIVENVRTFEVFAYANELGKRILSWDSNNLEPLYCMDLYLETMSEADAIKAAQLAASLGEDDARTVEFVESVVRRHYQRVYFPNKTGYYENLFP
jgi:prepilin-type N-terminal cleavage/methylation domain-containing protein